MDRYEFFNRSQVATPNPFVTTIPTLTALIPAIIHPEWMSSIKYFLHYAYPVVILSGIFFTLITLLALIQNVHMTSKAYLFTQTICDILFLVLGVCLHMPNYDRNLIPQFFNEKVYYNFLVYILWFIIVWLFLISCLDHTCTAIQSTGYNEKIFCSPCNSKNSIIGIILLGIIFSLPQLYAWEPYETGYRSTSLRTSFLYEHIYFWFLQINYLFIPLFAIFVFMGTLLYTLCRKKEHYLLTSNGGHYGHYTIHYANPHENSINYSKTRERENITKLFIFMCFLYLIFVLPYSFIIFFGKLFLREPTTLASTTIFKEIVVAYDLSLLLFYLQILMKFFVLTIFSRNFRQCLKKLITCQCFCCCCCCCRSKSSSTGPNEHNHHDGIYMK
ncbi:unnamed protein product [Rotaria magnacalcarata]|uniref:G-protein coupled receptors family 1 profile domain-containing protein n=1 Tax=Rotaria magnacalcarata TaxID=392030 RepID=A0A816SZV3_9BILA|nr:unnamed protein product [Rotaria magnacalcarata]CAF1470633.1 unnamed protein product [Rotaria magnacalcarata]CAF2044486.1 unnamed protein product [Rotaria magnacalcarata]CAF2091812.1 unnamed protein product [Rotaria magnacalcarata]CAF2245228.1 unnamed protein product [Rotaria magnacalcarata]